MDSVTGKPSQEIAVVNPTTDDRWNENIAKFESSTIFHTSNWAHLLAECYGFKPKYLTLFDEGVLRCCLPLMEVNSIFTGRRAVSLSFSDYCGALLNEKKDFRMLLGHALQLGKANRWSYLEFRGEQQLEGENAAKLYAHHEIELQANAEVMQSRLRESTARNIRKAIKEGITVIMDQSSDAVEEYYRLHCVTRRRQGVPPQPFEFFQKVHQHLIAKGLGFTALACQGQTIIAGIICLHFGRRAIYKYGASDLNFQHLRANNLLLWESIKRCAREGCRYFSLGRTDLDNEGLITFKNGWGGAVTTLSYHRYDFASSRFLARDQQCSSHGYKILLQRLPIAALRFLGRIAYRHMG